MNPLSIIAGPLIDGVNNLGKTFFGSKEERDRQSQEQFMSVQNSYQAEQSAPEKQNWFNIIVDGFNRLQRPAMTSGVIALFVWASIEPVSFTITMQALTVVSEMLWYILASVIAFWFSGRILEKAPMRIKQQEIENAKKISNDVITARTEKDWEDKYQKELKDTSKPLSNKAILEWNNRNKRN